MILFYKILQNFGNMRIVLDVIYYIIERCNNPAELTVRNRARPNAENSGNYHGTAGQPSSAPSIENESKKRVGG